jgi:multidrug efflux pump subunit AcrB
VSLVEFSLKRPFTVAAGMDIFPEINISVVRAELHVHERPEMHDRIATLYQRQVAQKVDNVARIEATNYIGVSVFRVFLHEGASTTLAAPELASSALAALKYMPRNIVPPAILPYSATDVPIIQLILSSNSLSDTALNDLAGNNLPAEPCSRSGRIRDHVAGSPGL